MKSTLKTFLISALTLMVIAFACQKIDIQSIMAVKTKTVGEITGTTASVKGEVVDLGEGMTDHGVYYSTSPNAKSGTKASIGSPSGTGEYTVLLSGLTMNTKYYVCAYGAMDKTFVYGNETSFTTLGPYTTNIDADGNVYSTITIGTQTWMKENLRTTKYQDGTAIPNITDNIAWTPLSSGAYCWYNNDAATYKATYGALYNWYTVVDSRKLCPPGWHVPTDADWTTLETYLGGSSIAGGKLKSTSLWISPNTGATNESGFTAFPNGYRWYDGSFHGIGGVAYWWTATEASSDAWCLIIYPNDSETVHHVHSKDFGLGVRCIRDN